MPPLRDTPDLLESLGLADGATLADLDMLTRAARMLTGASHAFVSFADDQYLWPASASRTPGECKPLHSAYCSALLASDERNLVSRNVLQDPRTQAVVRQPGDPRIVAYAGTLLRDEAGRKLGTLCVTDTVERDFDAEQLALLNGLGRQVMNLVSLRAAKRQLTTALAQMTTLARVDTLTGLLNRRAWQEEAETLRKLVLRQSGHVSVAALDLDHFKRINDSRGHAAGDAVLSALGKLLAKALRTTDRIGRIGGEEFAVIMPFTTPEAAAARLDALRQRIATHRIIDGDERLAVTVSCGVAGVDAQDAGIDAALRRADQALYDAKHAGRDRVRVAPVSARPLAVSG
ncbi:sensor domain-containing diguanylate cyclase [Roseateles depolymerans]|uniref:diguanylate cyclase n=1 Tax=Roseateles depolymerans TaxID=76731 RepID=A0A0U3M9G9_9BURK|nr:sensor domain-containing diguanylate cyclase [Roseateles depolymerans]ALV04937.1 hypothetical protein RD2015_434 [Roseateles depolymerans]REG15051.1 diguanylate cyclase (GGDEF)-like protein [Roseateles depolymerans]